PTDGAGADADAPGETPIAPRRALGVERRERALHCERAAHRALGMVGLRDGGAEVRHDPVAQTLVEGPAMAEDRLDHAGVIVVQERDDLLAAERLGEGSEIAQVAEENRDGATLGGCEL